MALGVKEQSSAARARQALFALGTPRIPIVAHPGWRSTLDKATAAIEGGKKVVAILGPEGVGKTTLLHEIAHVARQGIARPVTVLDDADQLGGAVMQRVAEVENGCLLMAGRPELALELSLMGPEAAIISMGRVWQADVPAYLDALCEQTGQAAALISPEAMERLGAVSSGLPGALMSVARMAALVAAAAKAARVEPAHVERAAQLYARREVLPTSPAALAALLGGEGEHETTPGARADTSPPRQEPRAAAVRPPSRSGPAVRPAILIAAGSAILVTGFVLWLGRNAPPGSHAPPAPPPASAPAPSPPAAPAPAIPAPAAPAAPQPPPALPQAAAPPPPPAPPAPAVAPAPSAPPAEPPAAVATPPAAPVPAPEAGNPARNAAAIIRTLPALAPPLVVVNYAPGSATAQARAAALAAALRANGFATIAPSPAEPDPDRRGIGFFFFEDQDAAAAVAETAKTAAGQSLGTPGLLPLTRADSLPRPGTIKVFIAGDLKALSAPRPR